VISLGKSAVMLTALVRGALMFGIFMKVVVKVLLTMQSTLAELVINLQLGVEEIYFQEGI
jgi:hypothetical protein